MMCPICKAWFPVGSDCLCHLVTTLEETRWRERAQESMEFYWGIEQERDKLKKELEEAKAKIEDQDENLDDWIKGFNELQDKLYNVTDKLNAVRQERDLLWVTCEKVKQELNNATWSRIMMNQNKGNNQ